jgi:ribonuclease Z
LRRASTGHWIDAGADRIIIDLGPGAMHRLLECGIDPTSVTAIFLSHLHFDHIGDLPRLLFHCWDRHGGLRRMPQIFGPDGTRDMIDRLFGLDGAFQRDVTARTSHPRSLDIYQARGGKLPRPRPSFEITELPARAGRTLLSAVDVSYGPVLHHQPYLDSLAFRVEGRDGVITYSSDIAISSSADYEDSLLALAKGADILVHYLNVFAFDGNSSSKARLLGRFAQRAGVKRLVTTHHGPAMDSDEVRDKAMAEIAEAFTGAAHWGEDRLTFEVGSAA